MSFVCVGGERGCGNNVRKQRAPAASSNTHPYFLRTPPFLPPPLRLLLLSLICSSLEGGKEQKIEPFFFRLHHPFSSHTKREEAKGIDAKEEDNYLSDSVSLPLRCTRKKGVNLTHRLNATPFSSQSRGGRVRIKISSVMQHCPLYSQPWLSSAVAL